MSHLLQQQLVSVAICPELITYNGIECILDHVDFPDGGRFDRGSMAVSINIGSGKVIHNMLAVEYRQPVQLYIKTLDCLYNPYCAVDDYEAVPIELIFEMGIYMQSSAEQPQELIPMLRMTYKDMFPSIPQIKDKMQETMRKIIGEDLQMLLPLDLGSLGALISKHFNILAAWISLNDDKTRLAFRLQFGNPAFAQIQVDEASWAAFLNGYLGPVPDPSHVPSHDWNILVGSGLLTGSMLNSIISSVEEEPSTEVDNEDGSPKASWIGWGGLGGQIMGSIWAEVDIGCWVTTIGLDPIFFAHSMGFSQMDDSTVMESYIDWNVADEDILACSFFSVSVDPVTVSLATLILGTLAENFEPNIENNFDTEYTECTKVNANKFNCHIPLNLPLLGIPGFNGAQGSLDTNGIFGTIDGLHLYGDIVFFGEREMEPFSVSTNGMRYGGYGNCKEQKIGYMGRVDITFGHGGSVCSYELGYPLSVESIRAYSSVETWQIVYFGEEITEPVHVPFTIFTTRGAATIELILFPPSEDDKERANLEIKIKKLICGEMYTVPFDRFNFWWALLMPTPPYAMDGLYGLSSLGLYGGIITPTLYGGLNTSLSSMRGSSIAAIPTLYGGLNSGLSSRTGPSIAVTSNLFQPYNISGFLTQPYNARSAMNYIPVFANQYPFFNPQPEPLGLYNVYSSYSLATPMLETPSLYSVQEVFPWDFPVTLTK